MTLSKTAKIKDTQCGFKLFSRSTLPYIVPNMHSEGWIFDVEMLMLAEFAGIPVVEVAVGWREVMKQIERGLAQHWNGIRISNVKILLERWSLSANVRARCR